MKAIDVDQFKEHIDMICTTGGVGADIIKAWQESMKKQVDYEPVVEAIPVKYIENYAETLLVMHRQLKNPMFKSDAGCLFNLIRDYRKKMKCID